MQYDVIIIGAGAAGLMCAMQAGKRGRNVLLLDHAKKVGEKIRISGGGRCNFTNLHTSFANYLSDNPRFCVSALSRYTPEDFIALVTSYRIAYHEKTLGQLFCDASSQQIIQMLLDECKQAGVTIRCSTSVEHVAKEGESFVVQTSYGNVCADALVIATGGVSIPKMGATDFGYRIAKQFGVPIVPPRPALVPFTLDATLLETLRVLSGISVSVTARCGKTVFNEGMLFTHRGLSGPAILQISSYWKEGKPIYINFAPDQDIATLLKAYKESHPKQDIKTILATWLPKRMVECWCQLYAIDGKIAEISNKKLAEIARCINHWEVIPSGTEGFRTAEVTAGGVDTRNISSQTFECTLVEGLYFIGEVLDVTGHLGGFNFQWAWASGYAAGKAV